MKKHTPVLAAIVVLILGGAVAAMASGSGNSRGNGHHRSHTHARERQLLKTAAGYIGIPVEALETDLHSGKSLGLIATESGKSETGLVKAMAATATSGIEQRISKLVKHPGGPGANHNRGRSLHLAAAKYLGIAPAALRADLHAGKTPAEVANATSGRSSAGLIASLVADREAQLPTHGTSPKPGAKSDPARSSRLRERITAFVDHPHVSPVKHKPAS